MPEEKLYGFEYKYFLSSENYTFQKHIHILTWRF